MIKGNPLSAEKLTNLFRTSGKDPLRIVNREGTSIEFKESYNHGGMAQYFKTMAAFANNVGGYIIFGVGDKPRKLLGLKEKNLTQFEEIKVEEFTKNLLEYFSPEIIWDHCTFEFKEMSFGVIYTFPLAKKPCICKKAYDAQNPKYTLKEGDIFYRYGGRSERIRYEELNAIIENSRKFEEQQWINFVQKAARIGIENAGILDLNTGNLSSNGGSVVIDESILSKIAFIKEGEFVETKGKPALRVIGDVENIGSAKIVLTERTKKVVKAIEPSSIVKAFLCDEKIEEPLEYIKTICSATSANFPFYFLIKQSNCSKNDAIRVIEETTSRNTTKGNLLKRMNGSMVKQEPLGQASKSDASRKKSMFREAWLKNDIIIDDDVQYCIAALLCLTPEEIKQHEGYIKPALYDIFIQKYETAKSNLATNIRKAICRIDEVLNEAE